MSCFSFKLWCKTLKKIKISLRFHFHGIVFANQIIERQIETNKEVIYVYGRPRSEIRGLELRIQLHNNDKLTGQHNNEQKRKETKQNTNETNNRQLKCTYSDSIKDHRTDPRGNKTCVFSFSQKQRHGQCKIQRRKTPAVQTGSPMQPLRQLHTQQTHNNNKHTRNTRKQRVCDIPP